MEIFIWMIFIELLSPKLQLQAAVSLRIPLGAALCNLAFCLVVWWSISIMIPYSIQYKLYFTIMIPTQFFRIHINYYQHNYTYCHYIPCIKHYITMMVNIINTTRGDITKEQVTPCSYITS